VKVGDLVVRAYSWHSIVPGIILREEFDEYESHTFLVLWCDGSNTTEMYEELDMLEDVLELINESR
jgi:hypothetical protein